MIYIEEIINELTPLVREKVRNIIMRKLSIWNMETPLSDTIGEETENLMKVIRPALWRAGEKRWLMVTNQEKDQK